MINAIRAARIFLVLPILAAGLWLAGCTPSFPRDLLDRVDRRVTFRELLRDPENFKGAWVMLGGVIIACKSAQDGTDLEILQTPLDNDGRPRDMDKSEGRFMVHSQAFLDPAVYQRGRLISLIGEAAGGKSMPLDASVYQYPVLNAKALQLWKPVAGPRFYFGIGVSGTL